MTSEAAAFQAAQQKHHRYMVFGKKQRYIEVFQCSGEDMNLVLTGGAVSPVAKALLSPGMLSSPPPPPTPTAAPPSLPPAPVPAPFDPLMAAAMQAQAIAHIRQNQESIWIMNQIAAAQHAQQQQHALALALSKQQQYLPEYLSPHHVVVSSAGHVQNQVSTITTKPMTYPPTQLLPAVTPTPYFVLNFPPRMPPPTFPKVPPPPQMANPYAAYTPLSFVPPPPAAAAPSAQPLVNLKRSWEQAFPSPTSVSEAGTVPAKRQFPPTVVSTAASQSFPTNLPPPPPAPYQPPQFYAGL